MQLVLLEFFRMQFRFLSILSVIAFAAGARGGPPFATYTEVVYRELIKK